MKPPMLLVLILVFLLIAGTIYSMIQKRGFEAEIREWRNTAAVRDTIRVIDSTLVKRAAVEVDKIKVENKCLKHDLREAKARLKAQINISALWENKYREAINTVPDIVVDSLTHDTVLVRSFFRETPYRTLAGYFEVVDPYHIFFNKDEIRIDLSVYLSQGKRGDWSTYLESATPGFTVENLTSYVVPYRPKLKEQLYLFCSGYFGIRNMSFTSIDAIGAEVGLGLKNHTIAYGINMRQNYLRYNYTFKWRIL